MLESELKKFSTAAAKQIRNVFDQKLTIGLDFGRSLDLLLRVGRSGGSAAGTETGHDSQRHAGSVRRKRFYLFPLPLCAREGRCLRQLACTLPTVHQNAPTIIKHLQLLVCKLESFQSNKSQIAQISSTCKKIVLILAYM